MAPTADASRGRSGSCNRPIVGPGARGLPVFGSTGVKLPLLVFSALFATHSVRRSQDGTTCCGFSPTLNLSTTLKVAGSIT